MDKPSARVTTLLVVVPTLVGAIVAGFGERLWLTRWVLVLEPVVWVVLASVALHWLAHRRGTYGIALLAGWLLFAAALRFPVAPRAPDVEATLVTARCTEDLPPAREALRVVSARWSPESAASLAALDADLLVVDGIPGDQIATFADQLGRTAVPHPPGTALFVRGQTVPCAGQSVVVLPGAFASLVEIRGAQLPVIALEHSSWRDAAGIGASALELASPYTVVLGATDTHGTFRNTEAVLSGSRLTSAPQLATWPARVAGLPTLPLYHRDRLWVGPGWDVTRVETRRLPGSDRLALTALLQPKR